MEYLKNKNIIIEGVEATGKSNLIKKLKGVYPFSVIQPSNYLKNSSRLFVRYMSIANSNTGILFDRFFISRATYIKGQENLTEFYSNFLSDKNKLVLLECDFNKILERMSNEKKLKFNYKSYSIGDIPEIASKMEIQYNVFKAYFPNSCIKINTTNQSKDDTLEQVLDFMKTR